MVIKTLVFQKQAMRFRVTNEMANQLKEERD